MSFFEALDYRQALQEIVHERKSINEKFGYRSLADAARIQRSYMSKVMAGQADLSLDQLYLVCEALKIDPEREHFLELLLNYARCGVENRRRALRSKIDAIATSKRTSDVQLRKSKIIKASESTEMSNYYLKPINQLVHIALTIPRFSRNPKLLMEVLNISSAEMQIIIQDLMSMNLLQSHNGILIPQDIYLHLNKDSPMFQVWKTQTRLAGLQRQATAVDTRSYSYTGIFSANEQTRKLLQEKFLKFLKELESDVAEAQPKDVYQLAFDLFAWT